MGDEVFASPSHRRMGAYAELAVVDEREAAHKPRSIDHVAAASLPLAALTAWDSLVRHGALAPGERVLVQGGAGGVGSIAVQLAKHLGGYVLATASARNADLVGRLGADVVIDYARERYEDIATDLDVAVDVLGPAHFAPMLGLMRPGGRILALATGLPEAAKRLGPWLGVLAVGARLAAFAVRARLAGVRFRPVARRPDGEALARIAELVDAGALRPIVDDVLPLEDAARAHARVESGHGRGKVVLAVAS